MEIARRTPPDLVLLDLVMPGMDGFATCRELKADVALREIPVIFLTASQEKEDLIRGFAGGGGGFRHQALQRGGVAVAGIDAHPVAGGAGEAVHPVGQLARSSWRRRCMRRDFFREWQARRATRRRPLTVFFSDIVGFTAKTEALGDWELADWLNEYLGRMARLAHRHGEPWTSSSATR